MGSIHYDFLSESLFFNQRALATDFRMESEGRIIQELNDYRKHIKDNIQDIGEDIKSSDSPLCVFSTNGQTPLDLLKQTALYINRFIVLDPLFRFTLHESDVAATMNRYIGMKDGLDKSNIARAAEYLKELTPMVAGDFVKVFPTEFFKERPMEISLK